jgi:hypothetical protein
LLVHKYTGDTAYVAVVAKTDALARSVIEQTVLGSCNDEPPPETAVPFRFWHYSHCNPTSRVRDIVIETWPDIRRNYAPAAAAAIDRLTVLDPPDITGRVVLLYGPPGTGKTTAIRSLAHAWNDWCGFEVVLDPDRFFGDPGYLLATAVDGDDDDQDEKRWRCFVLEDCDELLAGNGQKAEGQALSRLLNLSDGIFGQGGRTLLLITTNEAIAAFHPAGSMPGANRDRHLRRGGSAHVVGRSRTPARPNECHARRALRASFRYRCGSDAGCGAGRLVPVIGPRRRARCERQGL